MTKLTVPNTRLQLRNPTNIGSEEILVTTYSFLGNISECTTDNVLYEIFANRKFLLFNRTLSYCALFNAATTATNVEAIFTNPHPFELHRITGEAPSDISPTIATTPITTTAEANILLARFPQLIAATNLPSDAPSKAT